MRLIRLYYYYFYTNLSHFFQSIEDLNGQREALHLELNELKREADLEKTEKEEAQKDLQVGFITVPAVLGPWMHVLNKTPDFIAIHYLNRKLCIMMGVFPRCLSPRY